MTSSKPVPQTHRFPLWRRFFKGRQGRLRLVAVVSVGALAVIATFALLHSVGAGTVTVREVHFHLLEGNTILNLPWISPSWANETSGFPISVRAGTTFVVSLLVINEDNVNHTLVSAVAGGAFHVSGVHPQLPIGVVGRGDGTLNFVVQVPNANLDSSIAYVNVTVE